MSLFRNLALATFKDDGTKRSRRFLVSTAFMLENVVFASLSSLLPRLGPLMPKAWVSALTGVLPSFVWGDIGESMICTVVEGLKGGPYCLLWQELLSCELPAIPAAGNAYSTCAQNTVIIWITQGKQGQVSTQPMPSLWWRTCSLWHENQWYLHSVVTPCVLFPFEPLFSLNLFSIQTSICILFIHTVYTSHMFVWLGVHVLLSMYNGGKRRYTWYFKLSSFQILE